MIADILSRYWWMALLRGLLWIAFGVLIFAQPSISLVALVWMFGAFVLADGAVNAIQAVSGRREQDNWVLMLLVGLAGIAVGLLTLANPGVTALVLLFYIAAWAIVTGMLEIVAALRLRKEIEGELWLILGGLVSVAFGAFLMARPGEGALGVLWLIATFSIVFGATLVVLAIRARGFAHRMVEAARDPTHASSAGI